MKSLHIRIEDEHLSFFQTLIEEKYGKNIQEVVLKLINATIRKKFGIDDIKEWPYYEKTKVKRTIYKPKVRPTGGTTNGKIRQNKPLQQKDNIKSKQSEKEIERQKQENIPEPKNKYYCKTWFELDRKLKNLTQNDKWEEAYGWATNNPQFEDELEEFYKEYDKR
jgi:hypothetical protein